MATPAVFGPQRSGSALVFDYQQPFEETPPPPPPTEEAETTRRRGAPMLRPVRDAVARVTPSQRRARAVRVVATATDTTLVHPDFQVRVSGVASVRNAKQGKVRAGRVSAKGVVNPTDEEILTLVMKLSQSGARQTGR